MIPNPAVSVIDTSDYSVQALLNQLGQEIEGKNPIEQLLIKLMQHEDKGVATRAGQLYQQLLERLAQRRTRGWG